MDIILSQAESKLYLDCIDVYGLDNQLEQYAEECLEAALAVRKYLRAKRSDDEEKLKEAVKELNGEIVDTTNMSLQMRKSFINRDAFNEIWKRKIDRQIWRVQNKTQEGEKK